MSDDTRWFQDKEHPGSWWANRPCPQVLVTAVPHMLKESRATLGCPCSIPAPHLLLLSLGSSQARALPGGCSCAPYCLAPPPPPMLQCSYESAGVGGSQTPAVSSSHPCGINQSWMLPSLMNKPCARIKCPVPDWDGGRQKPSLLLGGSVSAGQRCADGAGIGVLSSTGHVGHRRVSNGGVMVPSTPRLGQLSLLQLIELSTLLLHFLDEPGCV